VDALETDNRAHVERIESLQHEAQGLRDQVSVLTQSVEDAEAKGQLDVSGVLAELEKAVAAREHSTKSLAKAAEDITMLTADKEKLERKVRAVGRRALGWCEAAQTYARQSAGDMIRSFNWKPLSSK